MPESPHRRRRLTRETKLLIVTMSVSALVLLALAQLRFPDAPNLVETASQPLDRLASRASYDELASSVARVEASVFPNIVVLRVAGEQEETSRRLADLLESPASESLRRHVPALRLSGTTAVAVLEPGSEVTGVISQLGSPVGEARLIATDTVRRLALIEVPQAPARAITTRPLSALATPAYIVVIEGTRTGITARPVFLGTGDRHRDQRWPRTMLAIEGTGVAPGAMAFSLDGQYLGSTVTHGGVLSLADSGDIFDTVDQLAASEAGEPGDAGIALQPLTPELAMATNVNQGVIVAEVDPDGPAREVLRPGDVITRIDNESITDTEQALWLIAAHGQGETANLEVARQDELLAVAIVLGSNLISDDAGEPAAEFELLDRPGLGTEVISLPVNAVPTAAGLMVGDLIVQLGDIEVPTSEDVRRVMLDTPQDQFALIVVRRSGRQMIVPLAGSTLIDGLQ